MQRQTLASALDAALKRRQPQTSKVREASSTLLAALERSATRMDQIVQRRIGLNQETLTVLK